VPRGGVVDTGVELVVGWGIGTAATGGAEEVPSSTDMEIRSPEAVQSKSGLKIKKRSVTSSSGRLVLA